MKINNKHTHKTQSANQPTKQTYKQRKPQNTWITETEPERRSWLSKIEKLANDSVEGSQGWR